MTMNLFRLEADHAASCGAVEGNRSDFIKLLQIRNILPTLIGELRRLYVIENSAPEIEAERVRLTARVAELEGALKPFADPTNAYAWMDCFRRARAALGPTP